MLRLITPPTAGLLAVDLELAKRHLNVDFDDDDDLIRAYLGAATTRVEAEAGSLTILPTTWEWSGSCFRDRMVLPRTPVQEVVSVKYRDTGGTVQTVDAADYSSSFDVLGVGSVVPGTAYRWPSVYRDAAAVVVRFIAGFAEGEVPDSIKAAILLVLGGLYAQRAEITDRQVMAVPNAVSALVAPYRTWIS